MTINQIVEQVKIDVLQGKFAVIKTINNGQPNSFVYGILCPNRDDDNLQYTKIFLIMQQGYATQFYPEADDFELVGLELHHPANNVYVKYEIFGSK